MAPSPLILVVAAASFLAVALSHLDDHWSGPGYGYTPGSWDGPENWGKLSPKYRLCGEGKKQSPINIVTAQAIPNPNLDTLARVYAASNATLINTGKDITMTFPDNQQVGTINITSAADGSKKVFTFKVIHWHSPSEHTIDGRRFPLELHLVHVSDNGDIAVIGILYSLGEPDSFYDQIADKLRELRRSESHGVVAAGMVELRSLQKRTGSYFRYSGSLTTPPCTEKVTWNILGKVREISAEQLQLLTGALPGKDNRPAQPLNGRSVAFYNPPNSTVSFQSIA
ncbi:alpha carbonic anhydrase 7 [Brachypodium distachyon]|uniref:alpha carbonic anhydrase 7 n=1 Tax=Brachypodium distachyon TaxID=15368 RepID=UPI000234E161|nr:alpha carbonic anhydrase 7 [Brachypodium distachyon]|eukprot:XP_003565803.1 alpha carbonic anhydrase 7 [Brachypodium distachyon]